MDNPVLLLINDKNLTHNDILIHLKTSGLYKNAIQDVIQSFAVKNYASENKIEVNDDELQAYVNDKRKELKMFSSQDVQKFLSNLGITIDQWADGLEYELLKSKVKEKIITDDNVEKYYNENKIQFSKLHLYKIVSNNKDKAEEILMEIRDDGLNFFELAMKYSDDENSRYGGGYMGMIARGVLPIIIEQKVFVAEENQILGPFEQSGVFEIYKIGSKVEQLLDDNFKIKLKENLFKMWLSSLAQSVRISLPN
jgi:parvulin-like peptidyl-prolyl isomerase